MLSVRHLRFLLFCLLLMVFTLGPVASAKARPRTDKAALDALALFYHNQLQARRGPLYVRLLESVEPAQKALNENPDIQLMYVDEGGRPFYYHTLNLDAAKTVSTDDVWPGGTGGYSLTGSGTALGELGIWDAGGVRVTHREFQGRATQMDSPSGTHFHATHVGGTMIAGGVSASAKGMSYQANLAAYDWDNDNSEMATAAGAGMTASNHSYTYISGWYLSGDWYWYGDTDVSPVEDYYFGFYSWVSQDWDEVAYNAPYYTIVVSAANDRDDNGPSPGGGHWVWDNGLGDWVWSTDTRNPDGGTDGHDCIAHGVVAKNTLSVGAVYDIPAGYSSPADVVMAGFSSWGPTDDGRIKPDLVANGIVLYSCTDASDASYANYSGTSMSSPNLSGSLNLLIRHYEDTHGAVTPLSSTMKAIVIQTADESGANPGPDYAFGWGLLNTLKAADVIAEDASEPFLILEDSLANGEEDTLYLYSNGSAPLRVTLAWTDPPGTSPPASVDPLTILLINDLDVRLKHLGTSTTYFPYILDVANPDDPATTGDNIRDNVEQIHVASPTAGDYMVTVSHKGSFSTSQWYSLVASKKMNTSGPDTTAPDVTVTDPNGGESLLDGMYFDITWIATDVGGVDSVTILYSVNAGVDFDTIATGEPNDSSYTWLVPATYSDSCLVRVIAYDPSENTGQDDSDDFLAIVGRPIPALGPWGQLILVAILVATGALLLRRTRRCRVAKHA